LNFEKFIAKRLHSEKKLQHNISRPILKMAIAAVSLSMAVMIVAIASGKGLQDKISDKVTGFSSDIQVKILDLNQSYETAPLLADSFLTTPIQNIEGLSHIQRQISKNSLIKTDVEFEGIVVKGVGEEYDWSYLKEHLVSGSIPDFSSEKKSQDCILSQSLADKLSIDIDSTALFYFQRENSANPLIRKLKIVGIYDTGMGLFDDIFVLADIRHLQKINKWNADQCSGLEIQIDDNSDKLAITEQLEAITPYNTTVTTAEENFPQIFDWIKLFDMNIAIVLILMIIVASINMISSLLIIILERTKMIGMMKTLGATNISIKRIFLYHAYFLLQRGLLIGNGVGLALCAIQYYLEPIQLDPTHYYVKALPISLLLEHWLLINALSIGICMIILIIPAYLIQKVEPIKALRYE